MTYIPRVGNHGMMIELKTEEASCLEWEHLDASTLNEDRLKSREKFRPDADGTCICTPYNPTVPAKFYAQDGPYLELADQEVQNGMYLRNGGTSLAQRLDWYDEAAEEERSGREEIWVD